MLTALRVAGRLLISECLVKHGPVARERPMRKPRILFVDDADEAVHPYQFYLERAIPCDVVRASNGYQALESARRSPPDIDLLDLMMPEMDGFETCRRLREDLGLIHTPIIILTKKIGGGPDERSALHVGRSEEHTSELQSHSFISYAVF